MKKILSLDENKSEAWYAKIRHGILGDLKTLIIPSIIFINPRDIFCLFLCT